MAQRQVLRTCAQQGKRFFDRLCGQRFGSGREAGFFTRRAVDHVDQGRKIVAWIPGARFVKLDSDSHILPARHDAGRMFIAETIEFSAAAGPTSRA